MNRAFWAVAILSLVAWAALAADEPNAVPKLVVNARYVYVTTFDGGPILPDVLSEDRQAVADVENALRAWGKFIVIYRPVDADLIMVVQKRGSEDILAVYDAKLGSKSIPLWRGMRRGGLDSKELPLVSSFRAAVEKAEKS